jgi:hypothetical protein
MLPKVGRQRLAEATDQVIHHPVAGFFTMHVVSRLKA